MRHARRGFTLIEVLVVIGIILVLVGMLVWGFRHVNATAAHKETVVELHVLKGMLADYEKNDGLQGIETYETAPPTQFPIYTDPAANINSTTNTLMWPVVQLADVAGDMSDQSVSNKPRYASNAVIRTRNVTRILLRIPSNRTLVENLPPKRILEPPPSSGGAPPPPQPIVNGVVLLDGFAGPIIFVPRGGLHVRIKDPTNPSASGTDYIVRSSGTFLASQLTNHPLTPADRPFFASAGQDSDFTTGEDNIYSFQE